MNISRLNHSAKSISGLPQLNLKNEYMKDVKYKLDSIYEKCRDFRDQKISDPKLNFEKIKKDIGFQ